MRNKQSNWDPISADARENAASRRLGHEQQCECGENRPQALMRDGEKTVCAELANERCGLEPSEDHHPAGKANNPATVRVGTNDHRADLSESQRDWPAKTLENRNGSPLLAAAAQERGYNDTNEYLVRTLLARNPEMLEALDEFLEERLGSKWWKGTKLEKFEPKGKKHE